MYLVVDTVSRNVLGECEDLANAQSLFLDLVAHDPQAAQEIKILSEAGREESVPQEEIVAALEAAAAG